MSKFLLGVLLGFVLTFGSVAGFSLSYLRDDDGWEILTAGETETLTQNISLLFKHIHQLRTALAKCSS
jgi:hypothetical protein